MLTRRTVLKTGAVVPSAAWLSGLTTAFAGGVFAPQRRARAGTDTLTLERFVYDVRFAEAWDVAQHVGAGGVALSPIADDLMDLWYDELDLLWKDRPLPLAGVTMKEALFVLETLAMDRQMRVVYRGRHGCVENGRIVHQLAGPATLVERFAVLEPAADWQRELASAMTQCPLGSPEPAELEFATAAPGLSTRDVPLVSWIIAPRSEITLTLPNQE